MAAEELNVDNIKQDILSIHKKWILLGDSPEEIESASNLENIAISLILRYCEFKGYTKNEYLWHKESASRCSEDYVSITSNIVTLDLIASNEQDVFDLKYFYVMTFWPAYNLSEIEFRKGLINYIAANKLSRQSEL